MAAPTYTASGSKATTATKLNKDVFDVDISSHDLIKQAYVMYQANGRQNLAKTLRRGEVRGGGKKPWKQKGTGRARFDSIRVPIWRGGGITFGPLGNENYSRTMSTKARRQAVKQALTINKDSIIVVQTPSFDGKTASAVSFLKKVGASRTILFVVTDKSESLMKAVRNVSSIKVVNAQHLNVYDIMNADSIVMTTEALDVVDAWLGSSTAAPKKEASS